MCSRSSTSYSLPVTALRCERAGRPVRKLSCHLGNDLIRASCNPIPSSLRLIAIVPPGPRWTRSRFANPCCQMAIPQMRRRNMLPGETANLKAADAAATAWTKVTTTPPTTAAGAIALIECYLEIWSERPAKLAYPEASRALRGLRAFLSRYRRE
jgi:hypothetical protein